MSKAVDAKEVTKFDQIANKYWDPKGPMRALHQINPLRVDFVELSHPLQDSSVLDVGCGGGLASEALALRGANVTAIDASSDMIETARLHAMKSDLLINYQCSHAELFAESYPDAFDVVTCFEMLEHVPNPSRTLAALCTMIKPGGVLICSTINRTFKAYLGAIIAAEFILKWVPKGTHNYARFLKPSEIHGAIRPKRMNVENIEGIVFQPFYNQFKRDPTDLDINYQLAARKARDT